MEPARFGSISNLVAATWMFDQTRRREFCWNPKIAPGMTGSISCTISVRLTIVRWRILSLRQRRSVLAVNGGRPRNLYRSSRIVWRTRRRWDACIGLSTHSLSRRTRWSTRE
eukprot:9084865-Pyramimonas_sp.AAC.1